MAFDPDKYLAENAPREFDPDAYLAQHEKPQEIPSTGRVARQAVIEGAASIPDMVINTIPSAWNLGKALVGTAADVAGRPDLAPDLTPNIHPVADLLEKARISNPEDQPVTPAQRRLAAGIKGAVAAGITRQPVSGMAIGAGSNIAGEEVAQRTGSPLAGIATSILTGSAGSSGLSKVQKAAQAQQDLEQAALNAAKQRNAPIDDNIRNAMQAGYVIPPGMAPGHKGGLASTLAGKIETESEASVRNQQTTNRLARQDLGLPENEPITSRTLQGIRQQAYDEGYAPLEKYGEIKTDKQYQADLDKIKAHEQVIKAHEPDASTPISDIIDGMPQKSFDSEYAMAKIKQLREDAKKAFSGQQPDTRLGNAYNDMAKAMESAVERHLEKSGDVNLLQNFRDARKRIAIAHMYDDALQEGSGDISAAKIAQQVQKNPLLVSGNAKTIGEFANIYRKANKTTAQMASRGAGQLVPMVGAAGREPVSAATGFAAAKILPSIARNYVLSKGQQQKLIPDYTSQSWLAGIQPPPQPGALYGLPGLAENQ